VSLQPQAPPWLVLAGPAAAPSFVVGAPSPWLRLRRRPAVSGARRSTAAASLSSQWDPARSSSHNAFLHGTHEPLLSLLHGHCNTHPICTSINTVSTSSPSGFGTHLGHAPQLLGPKADENLCSVNHHLTQLPFCCRHHRRRCHGNPPPPKLVAKLSLRQDLPQPEAG
jgi:hypothetical protein